MFVVFLVGGSTLLGILSEGLGRLGSSSPDLCHVSFHDLARLG